MCAAACDASGYGSSFRRARAAIDTVGAWLDAYPAQLRPLEVDMVPAHPCSARPGRFSHVLADLERDVANLPTRSPITASGDPSRWDRFIRRPPSYWVALDRIEELER